MRRALQKPYRAGSFELMQEILQVTRLAHTEIDIDTRSIR
jgi:hypothetical protein